jgi:Fe-S cluster assembly iron-binding protein IscA
MLHITSEARDELHGMLVRALAQQGPSEPRDLGFRLVSEANAGREPSQLGLALDAPRKGDEVVEHQGHSVLILDPMTSELLHDLTLDVVETPEGTRLGLVGT